MSAYDTQFKMLSALRSAYPGVDRIEVSLVCGPDACGVEQVSVVFRVGCGPGMKCHAQQIRPEILDAADADEYLLAMTSRMIHDMAEPGIKEGWK